MEKRIYLDFAATSPVEPRVVEEMLPYFTDNFGNPSSIHWIGQNAEASLENAREKIAELMHAMPQEIIFTGSGTEGDNLALRGLAGSARERNEANEILISPVEHSAILNTAKHLASDFGFIQKFIPVDKYGLVDKEQFITQLSAKTAVVAVIYGNNEIGTVNPVAELAGICRERHVSFFSDAVQAAAHIPINMEKDNLDCLAIGAHKFYGPKGVGVLYIRDSLEMKRVLTGGSQEFGKRPGTQNLPLIKGLVKAFEITIKESDQWKESTVSLRDYLINSVLDRIPEAKLTGHPVIRLANHASFAFKRTDGNQLVMILDSLGFACSSGSACKSGDSKPSSILRVLGFDEEYSRGSLRITLGRTTTLDEIKQFLEVLPKAVKMAAIS